MQAIILAAGESSRFWPLNSKHKSQIKILGKSLVYWTIKNLTECGINDIIIIHNPNSPLKNELGNGKNFNCQISYAIQEKPLGTGNAVFLAKDFIKEPFFVLHPFKFYIKDIIRQILKKEKETKSPIIFVATPTKRPQDYGILEFDNNKIIKICENPPQGKEPSDFKTLGIYFLRPEFFQYYEKIKNHHKEDLIDAFNLLLKDKGGGAVLLEKEMPTLKYPWNLFELLKLLFESENFKNHISSSAKIGKNVVLNGSISIGKNVKIGENTVINGPCFIGNNCQVGTNNVFRGPVNLENDVRTGAFTEIKNSIVQEGTHFHSGYIGDSIIGKNCRFGAGFITANRRIDRGNIKSVAKDEKIDTNLIYFGIVVGNDTRFGINVGTMPGVLIGSNCLIGPATIVRKNISDNTTFYAKFEEVIKKNKK
jgi:bifunctional UDP-N-acetylglucosamine pyrophosphorylase/glucosamine-1-phosphate N-acetyltransferase